MLIFKHGLNFIVIVILSSFETTNKNVELQKLKRSGMKQRHLYYSDSERRFKIYNNSQN
jgi:hypothetical protein